MGLDLFDHYGPVTIDTKLTNDRPSDTLQERRREWLGGLAGAVPVSVGPDNVPPGPLVALGAHTLYSPFGTRLQNDLQPHLGGLRSTTDHTAWGRRAAGRRDPDATPLPGLNHDVASK